MIGACDGAIFWPEFVVMVLVAFAGMGVGYWLRSIKPEKPKLRSLK